MPGSGKRTRWPNCSPQPRILVIGTRAIRQAHERRTKPRYYLRLAAMFMRDYPVPGTWRDLADPSRLRPLLATALEADRYQLDESRMIALDLATVVAAKVNRYLAVAALLTLGQDKEIANAVRKLTPEGRRARGSPRRPERQVRAPEYRAARRPRGVQGLRRQAPGQRYPA